MAGQFSLQLTLRDVEGNFTSDARTHIVFESLDGRTIWHSTNPLDWSRGPVIFTLESGQPYNCRVLPTLYRGAEFLNLESTGLVQRELTLLRDANSWQTKFVPWAELGPQFDKLRTLLYGSPRIRFVETGEEVAGFVEDKYDGVSSGPTGLAKATLLNLYYDLSITYEPIEGTQPFLSFVHSIEALGRDRILILADSKLIRVMVAIAENRAAYPDWHSLGLDSRRFYLPPAYRARIAATHHVRLNAVGNTLDIVLDELRNADFVVVTFGILQGTPTGHRVIEALPFAGDASLANPLDVHEWLMEAARFSGLLPDLGYRLVPLAAPTEPVQIEPSTAKGPSV